MYTIFRMAYVETSKQRLFVGVPLTPAFQNAFRVYAMQLSESNFLENLKVRWTDEENLHLTLCFLGSYAVEHIPAISETLTRVAMDSTPFTLRFDGIAWGPPARSARMVWGNFFSDKAFSRLVHDIAQELEINLSRIVGRNILLIEDRVVIPHVTLARFSDIPKNVQRSLPPLGGVPNHMMVHSFTLYQSILTPAGATYNPLHTFALKKQS
jgi:2'-5' RNA ligase